MLRTPCANVMTTSSLIASSPSGLVACFCFRSESLIPEECSVEELESGEMKAICTSEGKEYIYRVSSALRW